MLSISLIMKLLFLVLVEQNSCCGRKRKFIELINGPSTTGNNHVLVEFISKLLSSNVLYTPNNNKTRMVMKKLTSFIDMVRYIFTFIFFYVCLYLTLILCSLSYKSTLQCKKKSLKISLKSLQIFLYRKPKIIILSKEISTFIRSPERMHKLLLC